jgi:hypothetical protein
MYAVRTAPPAPAEAASASASLVPPALQARGVKRSAADDADGEQQRLSKRFGTMTLSEFPRSARRGNRLSRASALWLTTAGNTGPVFAHAAGGSPTASFAGPAPSLERPASPRSYPGSGASSPSSSRSSSTVRPRSSPPPAAPSSFSPSSAAADNGGAEFMQVESTPERVFIYDLAAEIAEAEAEERAAAAADAAAADRPVFLPDIEKHLMRLPRALLTNGGGGGGGGGGHGYGYGGEDGADVGSDESDDGFDDDDPDEDARTTRRHHHHHHHRTSPLKNNMQLIKYAEPALLPPAAAAAAAAAAGPASFASSLAALASRDGPSSTAHDRRAMAEARAWDFLADPADRPWTGFGGGAGPRTSPGVVARLAAAAVGDEYFPDDDDAMDVDVDMDLDLDL